MLDLEDTGDRDRQRVKQGEDTDCELVLSLRALGSFRLLPRSGQQAASSPGHWLADKGRN